MFHEREHSLHHSHEMTEKVGGDRRIPGGQLSRELALGTFLGTSLSAPLSRRSWTTPRTAFRRFPTTGTQRKRRDSGSPGKDWGSCCQVMKSSPSSQPSSSNRNRTSQFLCKPELQPGRRAALLNANSGGRRLHDIH